MLVATKVCLLRQIFVATKQTHVCRDKHNLVVTKVLTRQEYFCHDKRRVLSRQTCRDKTFVATNSILVAAPAIDSLSLSRPRPHSRQYKTSMNRTHSLILHPSLSLSPRAGARRRASRCTTPEAWAAASTASTPGPSRGTRSSSRSPSPSATPTPP